MKASQLMTRRPRTLPRSAPLQSALDLMDEHDLRHVVVTEEERVVGVVSERDLLELTGWMHPRERQALECPEGALGDHVSREALCIDPDESVEGIVGRLVQARVGCLPVVGTAGLEGVVSEVDVLRAYADACRTGHVAADQEPRVEALMTPDPRTLEVGASAEEAAAQMSAAGLRHLPVMDQGRLVGIVSDRDVRRARGRGQLELLTAKELMGPEVETLEVVDRLSKAALVLSGMRIGALPVLRGTDLVGILSSVDALVACSRLMAD